MTPMREFRLGQVNTDTLASQLLNSQGSVTGSVEGEVLEAQFEVADGFLIVTTDADPFEACLHFNFFSRDFEKVDGLLLGMPYQTGTFHVVSIERSDELQFSYFGDEVWKLEVLRRGRFVLGRASSAAHYIGGFWRPHRLILSRLGA